MNAPPDARPPAGLAGLSRPSWLVLALLVLGGAALRIAWQYGRPFTGDEGGTLRYIAYGYRYLLTHFADPWLSMNVYLCMVKFFAGLTDGARWALVLPGFLASLAAIPAMAALALRLATPRTALLAAALVAFNPFLVDMGVHLRAYSFFVLTVLGLFIHLHDWIVRPGWRHGLACGLWAGSGLLMHLNVAYYLLTAGVIFAGWAWRRRREPCASFWRAAATLAVPVAVALVLAACAYAPMAADLAAYRQRWSSTPPTPVDYLPHVVSIYFGNSFQALPALALLACGVWFASQHNRALLLPGLAVLLPSVAASLAGSAFFPWTYARYFLPNLPLLLLLVAAGVDACGGRRGLAPRLALVALLLLSWSPRMADLFRRKADYPWIAAGAAVQQELRSGQQVLALNSEGIDCSSCLLAYVPFDRFTTIAAYAGVTNREPTGLVVVTGARPLVTSAPRGSNGRIHWAVYRGNRRAGVAQALLADLIRTVGHDVNPDLTAYYRTILDLLAALRLPDPDAGFTSRYHQCLQATIRQRFCPPQMLTP